MMTMMMKKEKMMRVGGVWIGGAAGIVDGIMRMAGGER